nr:PAS domain S-box protein [Variovorax boronicumulans]
MNARLQPLLPWAAGLGALAVGLVLAGAGARWQEQRNREVADQRFEELSQRVLGHVRERVRSYDKGLRGLRGAVVVQGGTALTRAQMQAYSATRNVATEFPGARGFGVIWRVPAADEAAYVARARADGWPDFSIRQLAPHDGERFVIELIEPVDNNRPAVGLDIASEPARRRAALTAMHTGEATLSGPLVLVQAQGAQDRGFVVALPIYRPGMPTGSPAERAAATTGWTYAPLVIREVLADADQDGALYTLQLRDLDPVDGGIFHDAAAGTAVGENGPERRIVTQFFGRQWEAHLQATPAFMQALDQRDPRAVGLTLGLIAALVGGLVGLSGQALQRKRRMHLEVARRAAIVDSSEEAIIAGTLEGIITEWNAGAERLFGTPAAQALGRQAAELLLPPERVQEDADIRATIAQCQRVLPVFTTRQHADGSLIDVSLTASPVFDATGRCIGFAKIMRDIREARQAQLALAALNAQLEQQVADRTASLDAARHTLQTILDAMPSQIGYWDRGLRNQVANRAYRDWFGIDPAALHGRHMRELLGAEHFAASQEHIAAALAGQAQTFQGRPVPRPDGTGSRQALVNYLPDIVDGEVRGIFTLVHDVTELVEGRLALAAAERAQAALLQTLDRHSIVSVADRKGNIVSVNDAFCRISGYSAHELVGRNHRIVNSGHHERAFWRDMWRTLSAGSSWRGEVCNRAKDGSLYWVDSVVAPFHDAHGRIEKYVSIRTDITPIKRLQQEAETARREAERTSRFLGDVLDASTQFSIIACDPDGRVSVFNKGAERLLGYSAHEVVGRLNCLDFHDADELAQRAQALSEKLQQTVPTARALVDATLLDSPHEWRYCRKDGGRIPVSLVVTALHGPDGQLAGYLGIAQDISVRLRHEERLQQAVHDARRANESKSLFLANMSHEIRTPMNAVIGLAYVLERTRLDQEQAGTVHKIRLAGQTLLAIINDVLDLSKLDASEMRLERACLHLPTLVREVVQLLSVQADARDIGLSLEWPADMPEHVEGDATRLRQVLTNLLSNAIKFTERGQVHLRVVRREAPEGQLGLRLRVEDTGIGIAPDAVERLFSPFVQADSSTTRRFGGTGLGLSIVKQLVALMDGSIEVESTPGVGSTFQVDLVLPLADAPDLAASAPPVAPAGAQLHGLRVLVVDDNPMNLEVARRILALEQADVQLADNGLAAVQRLMAEPGAFDAVLMDVQMPVLDGLDATRRIRSALGLTALPIIGLTAGVSGGEVRRARSAGMNELLAKPIDPDELVRCVQRFTRAIDATPGATTEPPAAGPALPAPGPDWPAVEGIDAVKAAFHLRGDVGLFLRLLRQTLHDFTDLARAGDAPADAAESPTLAARLHQLKGNAGTLAASRLAAAADRAEAAARAPGGQVPGGLRAELAEALRALTLAAGTALAPPAAAVAQAAPQALGPADAAALARLREQLHQRDLAAMDGFAELAPYLRERMGESAFGALQGHVEQLDFGAAVLELEGMQ